MAENNAYAMGLPVYDSSKIKSCLERVNLHLGWYANRSDKEKDKIFSVVKNSPDLEMVRRFEEKYDVRMIGITECGQSLHINVYSCTTGKTLVDGLKIKDSRTSKTVQHLGMSIADLIMERSKMDEVKPYITQQMLSVACKTRYNLEKKLVFA